MNSLWTPRQVAEYLGVKPGTVYLWVKERRIPHVVLSRGARKQCVRFHQDEIEAWLRKQHKAAHRQELFPGNSSGLE
jgi:excisionase family DNA binding protein